MEPGSKHTIASADVLGDLGDVGSSWGSCGLWGWKEDRERSPVRYASWIPLTKVQTFSPPGAGPTVFEHLWGLGYKCLQNPEEEKWLLTGRKFRCIAWCMRKKAPEIWHCFPFSDGSLAWHVVSGGWGTCWGKSSGHGPTETPRNRDLDGGVKERSGGWIRVWFQINSAWNLKLSLNPEDCSLREKEYLSQEDGEVGWVTTYQAVESDKESFEEDSKISLADYW